MEGFLCVNKPQGPSSFQIVSKIRKALNVKKIGHAGTLDPDASGLLVIATGYTTRLLQYLPNEPKIYRFRLQFGIQTDTLDNTGKIIFSDGIIPSASDLTSTLCSFTGEYLQEPPAYSAKKINGIRAYKLARSGQTPQMTARLVRLYSLNLISFDQTNGYADLQVNCSGGTYVRSLARDIAVRLNTFGTASSILRIGSGDFSIDQALDIDNINDAENYIIPASTVFNKRPNIQLSIDQQKKIVNGSDITITMPNEYPDKEIFAFYGTHLLAVLQWKQQSIYHPIAVFPIDRQ